MEKEAVVSIERGRGGEGPRILNMPSVSNINQKNFFPTIIFMCFIAIALCWLPIVGSFMAGVLGSRKASGQETAFFASLASAIIFGITMLVFSSSLAALPIWGAIIRIGVIWVFICASIPLILGAIIGIAYGK